MKRSWVALAFALLGIVGCRPPAQSLGDPCDADAGTFVETTPRACDARFVADPSAVVDRASFREQASALVCDLSLRCPGLVFATTYCHPRFASDFERRGRGTPPTFVLSAARACVDQLAQVTTCDAATVVAVSCFLGDVTGFADGGLEGEPCTAGCQFGLACGTDGRCTRGSRSCGEGCGFDEDCASGVCGSSGCAPTGLGAPSFRCAIGLDARDDGAGTTRCSAPRAIGEACLAESVCDHGECDPTTNTCRQIGHVGCDCTADIECPAESTECSESVCTLRPLVGEPCTTAGAACLGGTCEAGTCRVFALGETGCTFDGDCEGTLVCASGRCGPSIPVGGACDPSAPGRCADGACLAGVCTLTAAVGDACATCPEPTCRHCLGTRCVDHVCE